MNRFHVWFFLFCYLTLVPQVLWTSHPYLLAGALQGFLAPLLVWYAYQAYRDYRGL